MSHHLAIFRGDAADKILSGQKTIETRFSKHKIDPFGKVSTGDVVYIKPVGKDIIGQFKVNKVISFDNLDEVDYQKLIKEYQKQIAVTQDYWQKKSGSKYATLIFIGLITTFITSPIKYSKKDMRGWVVLPEKV